LVRISSPKDLIAGLLFAGIAVAGLWISSEYPVGVALRMGPGYIPRLLFLILLGLGLLVAARSLFVEGADAGAWAWRPLVVIPGAMVLFGLAVERLGLVLTTIAVVLTASLSWRNFRLVEALIAAAALALFTVAVFVSVLRLNIPVWPS
jgi:putative tricarboxylic transport membrane protein